jgi:nitric oxide reductase NorQ protein
MSNYLFIRVEEVKKQLKFRFIPNQSQNVDKEILDSTKNIRIESGKSLKGFKKGAIYYLDNPKGWSSIGKSYKKGTTSELSYYRMNRWRLNLLAEELILGTKLADPKHKDSEVLKEYSDLIKTLPIDDKKEDQDIEASGEDDVMTYYKELRDTFMASKPNIKTDGFYISDSDWMIILRNIKSKINTLITGPTGCGKTTAIKLACEKLGIPCSVYDMGSMFDPISSLLGVHRLEGGSSKFDYAKFAQDIQKPGVILLDELSRAPIQSNNILFPCLDDRRTLPVEIAGCKDIRSIVVHPDVCFIATANIGAEYTGTNIMDRALQNRFFPIELNYPNSKEESKVLQQRCGVNEKEANLIVKVAGEIRNIYNKQELSISVSTRETLMIAQLVKDGWTLKDALSMVLLPLFEGTADPKEESTERGKIRKLLMTY